jgi:hypothetical protein
MSKSLSRRQANAEGKTSSRKSGVGYCRPPKQHQFKPGKSGNPKGRPRGAKNEATMLREILEHKISLREGGRLRKISVRQAILLKMADGALKGDTKKAAFVLDRYRRTEGDETEATEIDPRDEQLFDSFYRRVAAELEAKKDKK